MINPSIFKSYDIRGIYNKDFNESDFADIIRGILTYLYNQIKKPNLIIAFGYDARTSTPVLVKETKKVFEELNIQGVDLGLVSTPTFYFGCLRFHYDAGLMITASHNPKEYNGVKMVIVDKDKIIKIGKGSGMEEIKEIVLKRRFIKPLSAEKRSLKKNLSVVQKEVLEALKINGPLSKVKKLKIACDPANGMAVLYLKEFFKHYPAEVIFINEKLDGTFPAHEPNPLKFETLKQLQETVIKNKCDLGIGPDADGDRIFFVDENGEIIKATLITSMIADELLTEYPGETIVVDIRYTNNVKKTVLDKGGKIEYTKVGHAFITQKLTQVNGIFAGESSGHFFFRDTGFSESSVRVLAFILKIINKLSLPISKIAQKYYISYESGEINFTLPQNLTKEMIFEKIRENFKDGQISELDGISVDYPSWRFNLRGSNTEPLIRLNVESFNLDLLKEKTNYLKELLYSLNTKLV